MIHRYVMLMANIGTPQCIAVEQPSMAKKSVGSIADYDPMNDQFGSVAKASSLSSSKSEWRETIAEPQRQGWLPGVTCRTSCY